MSKEETNQQMQQMHSNQLCTDPEVETPTEYITMEKWMAEFKNKFIQLEGPPPKSKVRANLPKEQVPCRWYASGFCARGDDCWYLHQEKDIKVKKLKTKKLSSRVTGESPVALMAESRKNVKAMNMHWKNSVIEAKQAKEAQKKKNNVKNKNKTQPIQNIAFNSNSSSEEEDIVIQEKNPDICCICLEVPKIYGILSDCDHIFCLDCIKVWRAPTENQESGPLAEILRKKHTRVCPLCRTDSRFVIPSSIFPTPREGGHNKVNLEELSDWQKSDDSLRHLPIKYARTNPVKAIIIRNYLVRMKTIPCRYFVKPLKCVKEVDDPIHPAQVVPYNGIKNLISRGKVPYCRYGNHCHYYHPYPGREGEEYTYNPKELSAIVRECERDKHYIESQEHNIWSVGVPVPINNRGSGRRRRPRSDRRYVELSDLQEYYEWSDRQTEDLHRQMIYEEEHALRAVVREQEEDERVATAGLQLITIEEGTGQATGGDSVNSTVWAQIW